MNEKIDSAEKGILLVNCGKCEHCFGERGCFACIVEAYMNGSCPSRIILRNGYDTELPNTAVSIVRNAADGMDWINGTERRRIRCMNCTLSPGSVRDMIWSGFPEAGIREVRRCINGSLDRDPVCMKCAKDLSRALEHAESALEKAGE